MFNYIDGHINIRMDDISIDIDIDINTNTDIDIDNLCINITSPTSTHLDDRALCDDSQIRV